MQKRNSDKASRKPILLKIAPDLSNSHLDDIIDIGAGAHIAGVIATNTTLSRDGLNSSTELTEQAGGLSGTPLTKRSTEVISYLHTQSKAAFPIVGVGGIHTPDDVQEKLAAGASLVQLYTGFVYEGPAVVKRMNRAIK